MTKHSDYKEFIKRMAPAQRRNHDASNAEYQHDHEVWRKMKAGEISEPEFLASLYDRQHYADLWERVKSLRAQKKSRGGSRKDAGL